MRSAIVTLILLAGCSREMQPNGLTGDAARGRTAIVRYGCASCHIIPGIPLQGSVGPPLTHMARRAYIAGRLPNAAQNMIEWVRFPQRVAPGDAMPDLGVSEKEARDIAAYLYTLR